MIPRDSQRPIVIDVNCPLAERGEGLVKHGVTGILPGMLIDLDSTSDKRPGELPVVIKHATSGGPAVFRVAKNDLMRGQDLTDEFTPTPTDDEIEDDTASEFNFCPWVVPQVDEGVMVRVASGTALTNGQYLKSGGNGYLIAHAGSGQALCQVDDDSDFLTLLDASEEEIPLVRVKAL